MDYIQLLCQAQQNNRSTSSKEVRCYKTTFAPPKKLEKSRVPSANIKKYLAKKEEEEQKKMVEAQKKRDELLALRNQDKKAKRRVQVMLKRTKSANKSVMEDAVDNENTADTLAGAAQCDEDDYGYVSQEASAFHNKFMDKYQNVSTDSVKFSSTIKEVKDLNAAKKRVKDALIKEAEEEMLPHKRKRKPKDESEDKYEEEPEVPEVKEEIPQQTEAKKRKLMPPPVNFQELLKMAEQKHKEPIIVEVAVKEKSPERLMTQKEKQELLKGKDRRLGKIPKKDGRPAEAKQEKGASKQPPPKDSIKPSPQNKRTIDEEKSVKGKEKSLSEKLYRSSDVWSKSSSPNHMKNGSSPLPKTPANKPVAKPIKQPTVPDNKRLKNGDQKRSEALVKPLEKPKDNLDELSEIDREIELLRRKRALLEKQKSAAKEVVKSPPFSNSNPKLPSTNNKINPQMKPPNRPHPGGPSSLQNRIPGPQSRLSGPPSRPLVKKNPLLMKKKKRVLDSESEYDSELEDFIEDGEEDELDVSRHIKEIFGYDRAKYSGREDEDECMESNFAEQMREEIISSKIGLMEDLEDMRQEQEEKMRKKRLKRS